MARGTAGKAVSGGPGGLSRGTNQTGVRLYNERLVMSLIRRHSSMPKADIARLTGLSPQTISIIINDLAEDGLLLRGHVLRGRVGQPSVPFSLNPDGAYAFGLKIGRRSADLVLIDFLGQVRGKVHEPHPYPDPDRIIDFVLTNKAKLTELLPPDARRRIAGLGIASPFELWNWEHQIGAPKAILERWRSFDIKAELEQRGLANVYFYNDATAATAAELMLGNPDHLLDFLYLFIGSFVGGGVVLNGSLYPGRSGYAGAIGPMPIPTRAGGYQQLLKTASIYTLAESLMAGGKDPSVLWQDPEDWGDLGAPLDAWIENVCDGLAVTVTAATSVIDFQAVIIDGAFPAGVRAAIVEKLRQRVETFDRQGLVPVAIVEGTVGSGARAIGGACLPLMANFTQDREVLFKELA